MSPALALAGGAPTAPGSGTATVSPLDGTVATGGTWTVLYAATDPFTNGTLRVTIPAGWTAPQNSSATSPGYVTVTSDHVGAGLSVSTSGQQVTISVTDLPKPKTITLLYGDTNGGTNPGAKAVPPSASNPSAVFVVESDPEGTALQPIAASPAVNLQPGTINKLQFSNVAYVFQTTSEGGPYSVVARDTYGNPSPVSGDQTINLSSTSGTGTFSVLGGGAFLSVTGVTMTAGTHTVTFYYRDTAAGNPTITAAASSQSWGTAAQVQEVNAGPPGLLELAATDPTVTVDEYARITIDVTDIYGNPTTLTSNRDLVLTSSAMVQSPVEGAAPEQASGEFFLPGDHGTPITILAMAAGQQTAQVDFRSTDANGGNPHLVVILNDDPPPLTGSVNVTVSPGPVSHAASVVAANTPVVAGVSPSTVTVTVTDQYGNPLSGVTVSLACTGDASHTNPGSPTGSDGRTSGAVTDNTAENVTVTAKAGAIALSDNAVVTFVAGPVSGAASTVDAVSPGVADGSSQSLVTITALDQHGNPVSSVPVTLSVAPLGQGETLTQPPGLTDANGHAYGYIRSTKTGSWTVSAAVNGTPVSDGATILFAPGAAATFQWSVDGAAVAGVYEDVTLTVRDELNNIVTDFADTAFVSTTSAGPELWATGGGALGEADSLANGQWFYLFNAGDNGSATLRVRVRRAGSITLFAQRGAASGTSSTITVDNAIADRIAIVSGDDQTAVAGSAVANNLVVVVRDEFGNLVDGASVTFGNVTGGGSRDVVGGGGVDSVATTNGSGQALCDVWRLGPLVSATNTVTAQIASGSIPSVVFSATATPGPGTDIVWNLSSKSVTVNAEETVIATLIDDNTNPVPGKTVTISITDAPNGILKASPLHTTTGGTTLRQGTTDANGQTSVIYKAPSTAGLQDVVDAFGDQATLDDVTDLVFTSVASGATNLRFVWLGGSTSPAGQTFSFRIEAVDGSGNVDTGNTSTVNLVPQSGSGIVFSLTDFGGQTTTAPLVAGQRIVYGRGITSGTWTIDLTAAGLGSDGDVVQINSTGVVDHYDVTDVPGSVTAGAAFNVTVTARDQYGNRVTTATNSVNLDPVDPGTNNVVTPALLVPSTNLAAGQSIVAENYTKARSIKVRARDGSLKVGYSGTIVVDPAALDHIVRVTVDLANVVAGSTVQHTAEVQDLYNNPVPGETVSFSAPQGGGSVNPASAPSGSDGRVTFDHTTGIVAGLNVARAQILDGTAPLHRVEWNVQTIAGTVVDHYDVTASTGSVTAGASFNVTIVARDQNGNKVTTANNSVNLDPVDPVTQNVVTPALAVTAATLVSGEKIVSESYTKAWSIKVRARDASLKTGYSQEIVVNPATAYEVVKISGDGTIGVGGVQPLVVEVRDSFANPVPSHTVVFSVTSSPGGTASVDPTITNTDASGQATVQLHTSFTAGANVARASINDSNPPALETKTFTVNTSAGAIDHYEVAVPSGTNQVAGVAFNFTVTAHDANHNLVPDDVTVVDLSFTKGSGATFSEDPVTLVNGTFTRTVTSNPAQVIQIRAQTLGTPSVFGLSPDITVAPNVASGSITATAVPDTITADGISTSVVTSGGIHDAFGNIVATGTLITVASTLGGSIAGDVNGGISGVQMATDAAGKITFVLKSGTTVGTANVTMQAVAPGTASGNIPVRFAPKPVIANPGNPSPSVVTPGSSSGFAVVVQNTSATGVTLSTASTFQFTDGVDTYVSNLASATYIDGLASKTLTFSSELIPDEMAPGLYRPRLNLSGTDEFGATFPPNNLDLPLNSLRVVAIEIPVNGIVLESPVSRGQTRDITVFVHNLGPISATIESVNFTFSVGNQHFTYNPVVSLTVLGGATNSVSIPVTVLQTAPVGLTDVDAAVSGNVNGTPVFDGSIDPYSPPKWDIRSGANMTYVDGSLTPATVSRTKTHSIKVQLTNNGDTSVELQRPATTLSFDGTIYEAPISQNEAFGVGATKEIVFDAKEVPAAIQADRNYDVRLHLAGLENLEAFTLDLYTSSKNDSIRVVTPASVAYVAGSLHPTTVSRTISQGFELDVLNTGTAAVQLTAGSTTFSFGSGSYTATLNSSAGTTIAPATTTTLVFNSQLVNTGVGTYTPTLHLVGTENTLGFDRSPAVTNQVTVQNPADVNIASVTPSQGTITRDQTKSITVTMIVANNSEAEVRFDNAALRFLLGGSLDRSSRFVVTPPTGFVTNGSTLPGGESDALVFTVADNTSNTPDVGTYAIEGSVCVTDVVAQMQICVNTDLGGKGTLVVQSAGALNITGITGSQPSVTTNQTEPWTVEMRIQNTGGAAIALDLDPGSTFISFSIGAGWGISPQTPGPIVLAGGATDTLLYEITPSGSAAGTATINGQVRGIELNSDVQKTDVTPPGAGSVVVQTPASLQITLPVVKSRDPVTENTTQWTIAVTVRNTGGATADLSDLAAETYVEFPTSVPPNHRVTGPTGSLELLGFAQTVLTFSVSPTPGFGGVPGSKPFNVRVGGVERNRDLPVSANTAGSVFVELVPDPQYVVGSLTPSAVKAGDEAHLSVKVTERAGAATINLDGALTNIYFKDSQNKVFQRRLDTDSTTAIAPGRTSTIWFEKAIVPSNFIAGQYLVTVTVAGTENGTQFVRVFSEDNIEIRPPTSVRIDTLIASRDKVSQSQTLPWEVRMVVSNTGSGDVQVKPGPATRLVMRVGGVDVTSQYSWTSNFLFEDNGTNVLHSGATDALVFTINSTGSSPGNLSIYGIFAGFDTGALKDVGDDTFDAGWGTILVQRAATLQVTGVATSQPTVTQGQTTPWNATASVRNTGEAALLLTFDATNPNIRFVPDSGFDWTRPTQLQGGGTIVAGGATGTLVFSVSPTGTSPGTPEIHAVVAGVDTNSLLVKTYDTEVSGSGFGSIVVQERGRAVVQSTAIASPNPLEVNVGQEFGVRVQISNTGEANLKNVSYSISSTGGSTPQTATLTAPLIAAGAAVIDTFLVTADNAAGPETFTVDVVGGTDANSNQAGLLDIGPHTDPTEIVQKVQPSNLVINTVSPSQVTVTRSQTADWSVDVAVSNTGGAPLDVVAPAPLDISFRLGATPLTGYVVVAPARFVEKSGLRLSVGESATLRYTIDVTGDDTGTVTIRSDIDWRDVNDLTVSSVQGTGTVSVVAPSGLFVNTTEPDPATAPNTVGNAVHIDSGQLFTLEVNVQNIGVVEDVDNVQVRLTSSNPANPLNNRVSEFAEILRDQEYTFRFENVSLAPLSPSAGSRTDLVTATIISARSKQSGQQVPPGQPVDNTESVVVEKPADLRVAAQASDYTLSTGQGFTVTGTVANGVAQVDDTGELTLRLPAGFALEPSTQDTTAGFVVGTGVVWDVKAPSQAAADQPIEVKMTRRPIAKNTGASPVVTDSVAVFSVNVATQGGFVSPILEVSAPVGATDDTVSTYQQFTLRASAIAEATTAGITAALNPVDSPGFTVIDPLVRSLGHGTGGQISMTWRVTAPAAAALGRFQVDFTGEDENSHEPKAMPTDTLDVTAVRRATLRLDAHIARPFEATDNRVAIGSRFEIDAAVSNSGDAGIDPTNARVTIDFSQAAGYALAEGTAERPFTIGETMTWVVVAPGFPTPPSLIRIVMSGVPYDENTVDGSTGIAAAVDKNLEPIPISTEGVFITADNISASLGFDTRVVPKGTSGIEMLGIELANTDDAADPARIDSVLVTILDESGGITADPSRTLTEFYAVINGYPVDGDLAANPVVFVFTPGNIVLDPNGADTDSIVFTVSVASNASLEEVVLSVETAGDLVIKSTSSGKTIPVVDKRTLSSVAGRLRSNPLVILSSASDEYAHNYPNPFRAGSEVTRIAYVMEKEGPVTVTIFDIAGERVYEQQYARGEPGTGAGPQEVTWDGRNTKGDVVRNGIYVCQLEAGGKSVKIRIAVAK